MVKQNVKWWSTRLGPALAGALAIFLLVGRVEAASMAPDSDAEEVRGNNPNASLFPIQSHPYGFGMDTWAENWWRWELSIPSDQNPLFNANFDCSTAQSGPVFFIPPVAVGSHDLVRSCTVEHGKALAFSLSTVLNDFPCPDPTFHPAPGQSLLDFLLVGAMAGNADVAEIDVTLDGVPLNDVLSYHVDSKDLFFFKGDLSLQANLDSCITGGFQPAAVDAFFVLFKPLPPGHHTITRKVVTTTGHVTGPTTTEIDVLPERQH
ncbi:MAG TPA: hypothetical protein VFI53_01200 [Myxococcaceae bacterium]|nr:hypothetical protein [Myxococcaceae bacterium]